MDGALTVPPRVQAVPPVRNTSASSMQSPPASADATSVIILSHVEFHRRGRLDATITLHDGRSFGVVRQGRGLRRRSLYDRLRAIA